MDQVTPILGPLAALLRSRKVLIVVAAIITSILVSAVPELLPVRNEILTLVMTGALALVGGITVEDAAKAGRDRAAEPVKTLREEIRELVNELLDEMTAEPEPETPVVILPAPEEDHG